MESGRSRQGTATALMAASALVISLWAVIGSRGADAGGERFVKIPVVDDKSDCQPPPGAGIHYCAFTKTDSVDSSDIENKAVESVDVGNDELSGTDIALHGIHAAKVLTMEYVSRVGSQEGDPELDSSHNFDFIDGDVSDWTPCVTAGEPSYPCLRVPSDGLYTISLAADWEDNTTDFRTLGLDARAGCGPTEYTGPPYKVVQYTQPAASLPLNVGLRAQSITKMAYLPKGLCLTSYLHQGSGSPMNVTYLLSITEFAGAKFEINP